MKGTISRLLIDKGFGFIRAEGGADYFFHASSVVDPAFDDLDLDDRVEFEAGEGPKGPRAENVARIGD